MLGSRLDRLDSSKTTSLIEGRGCNVESSGFVFGLLAFIFAASALARIRKLEQQLKEGGVLKANHGSE